MRLIYERQSWFATDADEPTDLRHGKSAGKPVHEADSASELISPLGLTVSGAAFDFSTSGEASLVREDEMWNGAERNHVHDQPPPR